MDNNNEKINFSKPLLNDILLNDVSKELDMMFYDAVKPKNLPSDQCYNEEVNDLIEYLGSNVVPSKLGTDAGNVVVPAETEYLKLQNRELKQLNIKLESQIASIESEVSVKMQDILKIKMDAENSNSLISALTEENDQLKFKLQSCDMEKVQYKTLVVERLNETENLKEELCQTKKRLSSTKNQLTICQKKLSSKNISEKNNDFIIKKMESHFYALWKMLLSFAAKLSSADLLVPEEIALLQNQYQRNLSMLEMKDDDQIKNLLKSFSDGTKKGSTITSKFEDFSPYNSPEAIQKPIVSSSVPSPLSSQPELLATFTNSPHEDVFNVSGNIASPSCGITSPSELEVQPTSSIMNVPAPVSTEISAIKPSFSNTKDGDFFTSPVIPSHRDLETTKDKKTFHHPLSPVVSSSPISLTDLVDSDDGWNELMKTLSIFKNGPLSPFPPSPVKLESDLSDTSTDMEQNPVDCLLKRPSLLQSDKIDSGNNVGAVEILDLDPKIANVQIDQNASIQLSKIHSRKDFFNSPVMQSESDNDFLNNKKDVSTILDVGTAFVQDGKGIAIEIKQGTVDNTVNQLLHLDVYNCVKNQNDVSPLRTETAINEIEQNISMQESVSKSLLLNAWQCNEKETVILPCENAVTRENKQNCDKIANVDIKGRNSCDKDGVNKLLSDSEESRNSHRSHSYNSSALAKNEVKDSSMFSDIPYQSKKEVFNEYKSNISPSNSTCQNILPPALSIHNVNEFVNESGNINDCSLNTTETILCNSLTKVEHNLRQSLRLRSDCSKVNNSAIGNIDINHTETSTVKNNSIVDYCRARQMTTRFQAKKCLSKKVLEHPKPNNISVKPIPIELEDSVPKSNIPAVEIISNFTTPIKESCSNLEVDPTATKRLCLRIRDCFSVINNTVKMKKTEKLDPIQKSSKKRKFLVQNTSDINYCETNENSPGKFSKILRSPKKDSIVNVVEFEDSVPAADFPIVEIKSFTSIKKPQSPVLNEGPTTSETLPLEIKDIPKTEKTKRTLKSIKKKKAKKSKKNKTKKLQNVNKELKNPTLLQKVVSASNNNVQQDRVTAIFNSIQDKSFTQSCSSRDVHSLVNVLINPTYIPNAASLVLRILRHLEKCRKNPLLTFSPNRPSTELLPSSEKCIVLAVFHIEKKNKLHLAGLVASLVNSIHQIVLSKLQLNPLVLSSFCRLLTEICRQRRNRSVPLSLCCELLKMKHHFASFLIASIVGVWKELLQCPESLPGKEQLFLNALVLGALKQTDRLPTMLQAQSKNALSRLLDDPDVLEVRSTIDFLLTCIENQLLKGQIACEQMISSLIVMATLEEWAWLEDNLINKHIIPNLYEFGVKNKNEPAFAVFCDIYASLFLLCPAQAPENELIKYFDTGAAYVKDCAAIAWAQILLQQKCLLPTSLMHWLEENSTHPRIDTIRPFYKRRMMSVRTEIQPDDVIG